MNFSDLKKTRSGTWVCAGGFVSLSFVLVATGCGTKEAAAGAVSQSPPPLAKPSGSPKPPSTTETDPGDIPNPPASTKVFRVTPSGDDWARCFGNAALMVGKSKDELVKAAGIPTSMDASTYIYQNFKDCDPNASSVIVTVGAKGVWSVTAKIVILVHTSFSDVWKNIGGSYQGPEVVRFYDDVGQYWQGHDSAPTPGGSDTFSLTPVENLSKTVEIGMRDVRFSQPPVTAKRTVNTTTNNVELTPFVANPLFKWDQPFFERGEHLTLWAGHPNPPSSVDKPYTTWKLR